MTGRSTARRVTTKMATGPGRSHSELLAAAVDAAEEIADPNWVARLTAALDALSADDIDVVLAAGGVEAADGLVRILGVRLNPRFVRSGLGRAVIGPFRSRATQIPGPLADVLLLPAVVPVAEAHLGDSFDDPSLDQVLDVTTVIAERFSGRVADAFVCLVAASSAPAAAHAADVLGRRAPEIATITAPVD